MLVSQLLVSTYPHFHINYNFWRGPIALLHGKCKASVRCHMKWGFDDSTPAHWSRSARDSSSLWHLKYLKKGAFELCSVSAKRDPPRNCTPVLPLCFFLILFENVQNTVRPKPSPTQNIATCCSFFEQQKQITWFHCFTALRVCF